MLEHQKLCLNFYSLCFFFHFLFFFSLCVVNAFMRALMLFDPLTGEVPQTTPPCSLSPISTSRSRGSHDLLEAVRGMSSSGLCFLRRRGRTWDWVGRKIALQIPLAFSRPLERASRVVRTLNDLLAGFARRKTSFLWSTCTDVITRCFCQPPANTQSRCHNFLFQSNFPSQVETRSWLPLLADPHLASRCSLQKCWWFHCWGRSPAVKAQWLPPGPTIGCIHGNCLIRWRRYSGHI